VLIDIHLRYHVQNQDSLRRLKDVW